MDSVLLEKMFEDEKLIFYEKYSWSYSSHVTIGVIYFYIPWETYALTEKITVIVFEYANWQNWPKLLKLVLKVLTLKIYQMVGKLVLKFLSRWRNKCKISAHLT
jgi:hypothetical protein